MKQTYIVAGYRTAVGKAKRGGLRFTPPVDMAATVIDHLLASVPKLDPADVDDLIVGNAIPEAEQGLQMARWIAIKSKALPNTVGGVTVNRYCGSGVETISQAIAKVSTGFADVIIAGGTESMSLVPTVGYKTVPNYDIATEHPEYYIGMGLTAEEVAAEYKIGREEQDEFSLNSHKKALNAIKEGYFKDQIVPIEVNEVYMDNGEKKERTYTVDTDEGPRADTSMEALGRLRPAFKMGGTVTAGNSSQTSDGAAFVIVMSEDKVKELGVTPIARMVANASIGVNPRIMGIGPVDAMPKALKQVDLKFDDLDLIELNEAFAAQSLAVLKNSPDLDPAKVNINGGAIALGHPLGCTGTKLTVQLLSDLKRTGGKYGMVTACIGGGQGIAGVYELLN